LHEDFHRRRGCQLAGTHARSSRKPHRMG
jgi:hypothetical protein